MSDEVSTLYGISAAAPSAPIRERLPFVLPDFTRYSWVSELARSAWEPRIARVVRAWLDLEWLSVANGIRDCGLLWVSPDVLHALSSKWETAGLGAIQLELPAGSSRGSTSGPQAIASGLICVAVGAQDKIEQLRHGWAGCNHEAVGTLLGYPPCCRAFFRDVWVEQRCIDTTWAMAENQSPRKGGSTLRIEMPEAYPFANILWRWFGVRAVPHLPCRFECAPSIVFGKRLLEMGSKAGYVEEVEWITEILAWPVEWSALHGIAEVKSPLMKLATRTDATAGKCVVQWRGTGYPEEGALGLQFPYRRRR